MTLQVGVTARDQGRDSDLDTGQASPLPTDHSEGTAAVDTEAPEFIALPEPGKIPVAGPWITQRELQYVADAAATCWYGNAGAYTRRFEAAFAHRTGRKHAVALPSCTSGLHLALAALGIGAGDEVIVPDLTWIASAAPVSYVGATTVFADVDPVTWCLSPESFESCITERTRAVIPVDLYGGMPAMDEIVEIAGRHGIAVIEDAAEAAGASYRGGEAGSWGVASTFSFHGSKTLTTGEGGMILCDDDGLHERVLFLRDHGRRPGDVSFCNQEVAFKYRMSDLQAAMGLAQVERLDELVHRKREIFSWYSERLSGVTGLILNQEPRNTINVYWMVSIVMEPGTGMLKDDLRSALSAHSIDTRPFFNPLSSIPAYFDTPEAIRAREENVYSYRISPHAINLPSALSLSEADVEVVCSALKSCFSAAPGN